LASFLRIAACSWNILVRLCLCVTCDLNNLCEYVGVYRWLSALSFQQWRLICLYFIPLTTLTTCLYPLVDKKYFRLFKYCRKPQTAPPRLLLSYRLIRLHTFACISVQVSTIPHLNTCFKLIYIYIFPFFIPKNT
jgi:hypothetical protein